LGVKAGVGDGGMSFTFAEGRFSPADFSRRVQMNTMARFAKIIFWARKISSEKMNFRSEDF
jgi:hypothetical protein